MAAKTLSIECRCVPQNPFYVRWINRYGGFDYWMFEKRQTFEVNQSDIQLLEPYIPDFSAVSGTTKLVSKEVEETVLIGAANLTDSEWRIISWVARSALIQWYSEENQAWVDVVLSKGKMALQTDVAHSSMELTLTLPTPQLAI